MYILHYIFQLIYVQARILLDHQIISFRPVGGGGGVPFRVPTHQKKFGELFQSGKNVGFPKESKNIQIYREIKQPI